MNLALAEYDKIIDDELSKIQESLSEYKKTIPLFEFKQKNKQKIAYLNWCKNFVILLNNNFFLKFLTITEFQYFLLIISNNCRLKSNIDAEKNQIIYEKFKNIVYYWSNEFNFLDTAIKEIKSYPSPRQKKRTLRISDEAFRSVDLYKIRISQIKENIDNLSLNPPKYMQEALNNMEYIIEVFNKLGENYRSKLNILYYYYDLKDINISKQDLLKNFLESLPEEDEELADEFKSELEETLNNVESGKAEFHSDYDVWAELGI